MNANRNDYRMDWLARDRQTASEPDSLIDAWPFLISMGVVAIVLFLARAWGWV